MDDYILKPRSVTFKEPFILTKHSHFTEIQLVYRKDIKRVYVCWKEGLYPLWVYELSFVYTLDECAKILQSKIVFCNIQCSKI
jgi:hypothetical protein